MKHIKPFQLNEIHFSDKFPQMFSEFREKYLKIAKADKYDSYFVQFTNFKGDVLDRTSQENTDHYDPMGNYAYPLKYVVNNPADLWYGMDANNLRILKKTAKCRTLKLTDMSENDCRNLVEKIYKNKIFSNILQLLKNQYDTRLGSKNSGYWGRVFFQALQTNLDSKQDEKGNYDIRGEKEQTNILLRLGYNAIQDDAQKDTTAVINHREPQQICFLDRKSFEVVEIFNLTTNNKKKGVSASFSPNYVLGRKWVSAIFAIMDDKIKEVTDNETHFYSIKGREITIDFLYPDNYTDGKILFRKTHKEFKLSDVHLPEINIITEKGDIQYSAQGDETLADILEAITTKWNSIKNNPNVEGWVPRNKAFKKAEEERKREAFYKKQKEQEKADAIKQVPKFKARLEEWKQMLNYNFDITNNTNELASLVEAFECYDNIARLHKVHGALERINKDIQVMSTGSDSKFDYSWVLMKLDNDVDEEYILEFLKFLKVIIETLLKYEDRALYFNFYNYKMKEPEVIESNKKK